MNSERKFAFLRIAFGCVWAIDAWFKWQPAFISGLVDMLKSMLGGEPLWVQAWINFWIHIISFNPHLFAVIIALIETIIAFGLIFGLLTPIILAISIIFSILLWSIGEGFGGPYVAGSTDIGCAIIYAFMGMALFLGTSWRAYSIDSFLQKKYPQFFLWKNTGYTKIHEDKKDNFIKILILVVIILGSVILASHVPQSSSSEMGQGRWLQPEWF